jgi:hypothetical protein
MNLNRLQHTEPIFSTKISKMNPDAVVRVSTHHFLKSLPINLLPWCVSGHALGCLILLRIRTKAEVLGKTKKLKVCFIGNFAKFGPFRWLELKTEAIIHRTSRPAGEMHINYLKQVSWPF